MIKKILRQSEDKPQKILLIVAGGIGKSIAATAVTASIRAAWPRAHVAVATAYPFVWLNNSDVDETVDLSRDHSFYVEKIKDKNWRIFAHDPYGTEDFLYRRSSLINIWCKLIGVDPVSSRPILHFTKAEQKIVKNKLPKTDKPLFFIQTNGGGPQQYPISWARDLPLSIAEEVVQEMNAQGYESIHIRHNGQPTLPNTSRMDMTSRELMYALTFSAKRLFIDSFAQHAAAGLNLPSVVVWITNTPKVFGYTLHDNITCSVPPSFRHYPDSYLERFDIAGAIEQCPYDTDKLFEPKVLLDALQKQSS